LNILKLSKFNFVNRSNLSSMANSVSVIVTQALWGHGASSSKFKHPNGTYSAV